jgi:preprotein translocase subunit YajC
MSLFKQLRGKRVMISKPESENKSLIELTPEVEAQLEKEAIAKWTRLKVYAVGTEVTDIKAGDEVYITPGILANAEIFKVEEEVFMIVQDHAIAVVY